MDVIFLRSNDVIESFTMYHTCHVGFVAGWTVDSSNIDFCTTARSKESVMKRMVASFRSGEGEFQPRIIASPIDQILYIDYFDVSPVDGICLLHYFVLHFVTVDIFLDGLIFFRSLLWL